MPLDGFEDGPSFKGAMPVTLSTVKVPHRSGSWSAGIAQQVRARRGEMEVTSLGRKLFDGPEPAAGHGVLCQIETFPAPMLL